MLSPEKIHWFAEADRAFFKYFFYINIHDGELYTVACMWLKDLMDFCISNVCLLPCIYDIFLVPLCLFACSSVCIFVCTTVRICVRRTKRKY